MKRAHSKCIPGFTLIELLVVIAIIGVLAALIARGLSEANARAKLTKCMSNQRQIGFGFHMYAEDHDDYFPRHSGFANYGGKAGTNPTAMSGGDTPATERPMNRYVATDVFHCPADRGAIFNDAVVASCWEWMGNSYRTLWHWGPGVVDGRNQVTGDSTLPWDDVNGFGQPGKLSVFFVSPRNKVLQGDAIWRMREYPDHRRLAWHPPKNKREDIKMSGQWPVTGRRDDYVLFADCHVDFIFVPRGWGMASQNYLSEWW